MSCFDGDEPLQQQGLRELAAVLREGVEQAPEEPAQVLVAAVQVEHVAVRPLGADLEELLLVAAPVDDEPPDAVHPAVPHEHVDQGGALEDGRSHASPPHPGAGASQPGAAGWAAALPPPLGCGASDRANITYTADPAWVRKITLIP